MTHQLACLWLLVTLYSCQSRWFKLYLIYKLHAHICVSSFFSFFFSLHLFFVLLLFFPLPLYFPFPFPPPAFSISLFSPFHFHGLLHLTSLGKPGLYKHDFGCRSGAEMGRTARLPVICSQYFPFQVQGSTGVRGS